MTFRTFFRACGCTILGAATTFAIAWTIAAATTIPMYPRDTVCAFVAAGRPWTVTSIHRFGVRDNWWLDLNVDTPGAPEAVVRAVTAQARSRTDPQRPRLLDGPPTWGSLASLDSIPRDCKIGSDTAFGWPFVCAWYQVSGILTGNTVRTDELTGAILLRGQPGCRGRDFAALPLRPIWSGLVLDTALYAAAWWGVIALVPASRRALRRRRGLCTGCGYDLRGTLVGSACPECGSLVR